MPIRHYLTAICFSLLMLMLLAPAAATQFLHSHASTALPAVPATLIFPSSTISAKPSRTPDSNFQKTTRPLSRLPR